MFLSIPRVAARRESQGTRDTTPVCESCFTARRRCTRYWRRAPCLWAPRTRGPLTQGPRGVHRTRLVDPMTGISRRANGRAVAALCSAVQDRTAREGLKARRKDRRSGPRSAHHFAASLPAARPLTRRRAVIERRHCQQAASNDARVCPALCLGKGASARAQDHVANHAQVRGVIRLHDVAQAQEIIAAIKPSGDKAIGACTRWTRGTSTCALSGPRSPIQDWT